MAKKPRLPGRMTKLAKSSRRTARRLALDLGISRGQLRALVQLIGDDRETLRSAARRLNGLRTT